MMTETEKIAERLSFDTELMQPINRENCIKYERDFVFLPEMSFVPSVEFADPGSPH
jgi:hypothetical protein